MTAGIQSRSPGKEAVSVRHLADVFLRGSSSAEGTGTAVAPEIQIFLRIKSHHPFSCRAGGGVNPHHLFPWAPQKTVRIALPQIRLGEKGKFVQIFDAADVSCFQSLLFHLLSVVRDMVPYMLHLFDQTLALPGSDLLPGCGFNFFLKKMFHFYLSFPFLTHFFPARRLSGSSPGTWAVRFPQSPSAIFHLPGQNNATAVP